MKTTFETSATVDEVHQFVIPAKAGIQDVIKSPRSGQSRVCGVVPLRASLVNYLDSRLRGNDDYGNGNCVLSNAN
ncbi:MAG: hypothetical protein SCG84_04985 [Nitrosomonadaceae bacterium]|nr:hypothetical protein [Nitrosospira sp.]MDW7597640.1 hypothetical protein [Nitrosomonadaceae bacterium]MBI0411366.1 hypothetical protein [Nitrosospira sp.]MDW7619220.1 hypothetical protein [Nitrosomonadaceae bacterium]MDW7647253.1 hypothetical protein [Nitrosomonadaceae bacterium]